MGYFVYTPVRSVNYYDLLGRYFLFVFMLVPLCFCVATFFFGE